MAGDAQTLRETNRLPVRLVSNSNVAELLATRKKRSVEQADVSAGEVAVAVPGFTQRLLV